VVGNLLKATAHHPSERLRVLLLGNPAAESVSVDEIEAEPVRHTAHLL
jgi:hypothetical protein